MLHALKACAVVAGPATQLGLRQGTSGPNIEEAVAQEPALAAKLERLFVRAREQPPPSASAAAAAAADELEGEMARAAATTLHAALLELLAISPDVMPHICADEAPPPALHVRAYIYTGSPERSSSHHLACRGYTALRAPVYPWLESGKFASRKE